MLAVIFDFGRNFSAVLLTGITIKLTDDYLDQAIDRKIGYFSFAGALKEGILPYCLLFFALAIGLNKSLSLALFFSSYIVGMFNDMKRPLSFGLKGYQESLIVFLISLVFVGWQLTLISLCLVCVIQIFDDYLDFKEDQVKGCNNLIFQLGKVESAIISVALIITASYVALNYSLTILAGYFFINGFLFTKKGDTEKV